MTVRYGKRVRKKNRKIERKMNKWEDVYLKGWHRASVIQRLTDDRQNAS